MSRTRRVSLVAGGLAVLACSVELNYVLSNRSATPIDVLYSFRAQEGGCPLAKSFAPAFSPTDRMGWWSPDPEWRKVDPRDFVLDEEACTIHLRVPAQTSLLMAEWGSGNPLEAMEGWSLTIRSPVGAISLSDQELGGRFVVRAPGLYELSYRAPEAG